MRSGLGKRMMLPLVALGLACALPQPDFAQTPGANSSQPAEHKSAEQQKPAAHKRHRKAKAEPVAQPAPPPVEPNMLQQPASPATVKSANNELTVTAHNSSLSQILHLVSSQTGMKLDGMSTDERVFGSFGPAAPREVITALLNGTSYNLIMVGDLPNGAPRELLLSRRSGGPGSSSPSVASNGSPNTNGSPDANAMQDQEQPPPAQDENPPEDNSNGDDNTDDSAPPMQYTPPSITPAEPNQQPENQPPESMAPTPRTIPMQPPPQQ